MSLCNLSLFTSAANLYSANHIFRFALTLVLKTLSAEILTKQSHVFQDGEGNIFGWKGRDLRRQYGQTQGSEK